ncbi:hypothetical protein ACWGKS_29565, partial [Nocardiopsis sp. NPDC055879]
LVAEYTRPQQVVADLTGTDQITEHTRTLDRSYRALSPTLQHPGASAFEEVAWADLAVTTVSAPTPCVVPTHVQRRRVRARLEFAAMLTRPGGVVAVITPIGHAPSGVVDPAPGVVRAATCAGLVYIQHVIALTVPICEQGLGATIPVRGQDGFDPEKDTEVGGEEDEVGLPHSVAEAAATITSPAHLNVSVFRKKGRSVPADSRGEVGA